MILGKKRLSVPSSLIIKVLFVGVVVALGEFAYSEPLVYINHAPDRRHSINDVDSKIVIDLEGGTYRVGNGMGIIGSCAKGANSCLTIDFFALLAIPDDWGVGREALIGQYRFQVVRDFDISIFGAKRFVRRVDVFCEEKIVNSYLFDRSGGVVAIFLANFGNPLIPESIYFLSGTKGLFFSGQVLE